MRVRRRVALFMDLRSDYDHGIAQGVIRYAKEQGSWRLFGHGWTLAEVEDLDRWKGDGIIARIRNREEARSLTAPGVPVVDVAGAVDDSKLFPVTNDDFETGRVVGEHFLACGLRRFAYCGVEKTHWSRERRRGFAAAVRAVPAELASFEQVLPWWERPGMPGILRRWLSTLLRPIGIMASNDTVGVKVTEACQALGIQVPQEVAVTGVDNEDVLCELASPTLSSVPCDCARIGYEAAAILDGLMSGKAVPPPPLRVAPRPLVVRASSDMLATDDEAVKMALRFIRNHADLSINVSDVLRAVPLCRRSLEIRFRKALGHTLHDEIRRTRLQRACRLLDETNLPVAKIALLSGFSSHPRFHTVFRSELGQAPLAYRKRLRTPRRG